MRYDWPALEPLTPKRPNKMTIPNIGYKANSIYERDAIFDELEKMGWPVEPPAERGDHMFICAHESGSKFWASNYVGGKDSPPLSPSPESFLAAAREALKPKYPTETLHAKCNSPFELRGCIQALHEVGVKISNFVNADSAHNKKCNGLRWDGKEIDIIIVEKYNLSLSPLSEFMGIFLKPGKAFVVNSCNSEEKIAEPKRETPPKIVGRKYRATSDGRDKKHYIDGDVLVLTRDDGTSIPWFKNLRTLEKCCVYMEFLELLPEEPWTAEYKRGDSVWVLAKVTRSYETGVNVTVANPHFNSVKDPSQIRKA